MPLPPIHRVVTGHDAHGKAVVASNGPLPTVAEIAAIPGTVFHEVWPTTGSPAPVGNGADPTPGPLMLPPPSQRGATQARQRGGAAGHQPCVGQPLGTVLPHAVRAGGRAVQPRLGRGAGPGRALTWHCDDAMVWQTHIPLTLKDPDEICHPA